MQEPKTGLRANSTDRDAMLAAFARHFGNLSKKELGQLFDKYRLMGRLDIRWNDRTGEYAKSVAHSMVRKLSKKGDLKGVKAWRLVSAELLRLERERMSHPVPSNMRAKA